MKGGFCEKTREKNPTFEERTPGCGKWGEEGGRGGLLKRGGAHDRGPRMGKGLWKDYLSLSIRGQTD